MGMMILRRMCHGMGEEGAENGNCFDLGTRVLSGSGGV